MIDSILSIVCLNFPFVSFWLRTKSQHCYCLFIFCLVVHVCRILCLVVGCWIIFLWYVVADLCCWWTDQGAWKLLFFLYHSNVYGICSTDSWMPILTSTRIRNYILHLLCLNFISMKTDRDMGHFEEQWNADLARESEVCNRTPTSNAWWTTLCWGPRWSNC